MHAPVGAAGVLAFQRASPGSGAHGFVGRAVLPGVTPKAALEYILMVCPSSPHFFPPRYTSASPSYSCPTPSSPVRHAHQISNKFELDRLLKEAYTVAQVLLSVLR